VDALSGPSPGTTINHYEKPFAPAPAWPQYNPEPAPQYATPQPAATGHEADIFAKIERLADLHQKGILTPEEFTAKKVELLSRL
jgi:hypothetical protein